VDHLDVGDRDRRALPPHAPAPRRRGVTSDARPARDDWRLALVVVAAAGLVRLLVAALIPLFPDEAYYWAWGRHLAGGYFDHPWAIAALTRGSAAILAPLGAATSPLAVRLLPVLAGIGGSFALAATARRVGGDAAAVRAAVIVAVLPLAAAGPVLATPDAPLLAALSAALYLVVRALQSPLRSRASLGWWCAAGIALGLAFSSKYTSILFPVGVVLAVLASRALRPRLLEPGPYVACVLATVVFLPVLLWNADHGWISFVFQLRHGLGAPRGSPMGRELELIGGQAGLASPILFVLLVMATWRGLRAPDDGPRFLLATLATFVLAFFVFSAARKPVEPNWPAPAIIPAVVLLAAAPLGLRARPWLRAGIWLAGALSALIYVHGMVRILPIAPRRDPLGRAFGWREMATVASVAADSATRASGAHAWLAADRYQEASELAFHAPGQPTTFAVNLSGRRNQYDLWPRFPDVARQGDALVLVLDEVDHVHHSAYALQPFFETMTMGPLVELRRGEGVIGRRRIWILTGYRGGWPEQRWSFGGL
jgi:4-amino-4-deoxy-L-arabinose transferase-like glycosyltransferase